MRFVLQANYTFYFVDKLKTLSETLLKVSSAVQGAGKGQVLGRLQVSGARWSHGQGLRGGECVRSEWPFGGSAVPTVWSSQWTSNDTVLDMRENFVNDQGFCTHKVLPLWE